MAPGLLLAEKRLTDPIERQTPNIRRARDVEVGCGQFARDQSARLVALRSRSQRTSAI